MSSGDMFASGEAPGKELKLAKVKELEPDEDDEVCIINYSKSAHHLFPNIVVFIYAFI